MSDDEPMDLPPELVPGAYTTIGPVGVPEGAQFQVIRDSWHLTPDGTPVRVIHEVKLLSVSLDLMPGPFGGEITDVTDDIPHG